MNNIDNNNIELNKQKTNLKKSILVLLIVSIIGVLGVTLANVNKKSKVEVATGNYNVIITGNTQLSPSGLIPINNTSDTISPDNISNYSDSIFISDFTVKGADTNPVDQGIIYDIALIDSNIDTNLLNEYLKWELIKNNEILTSGNFKDLTNGQRYVLTDIQQDLPEYTQTADSLKLVIWINNNFPDNFDQTTMMNKSFSSTIDVELYTKSKIGQVHPKDTLYYNITKDAVIDNTSSEYVTSSTGIDFTAISSDTNGKGIYIRAGTENDRNPIYYYRGDVNNNNVLFANFCWKIVRTTDTGGIKLIYNGTPSNGKCTNTTGDSTHIGKIKFNASNNSPTYVGYMYGTPYTYTKKDMSDDTNSYVYGNSVTYNNGNYTLVDTLSDTYSSLYDNGLKNNHYTCFTTSNICSDVYYIYNTENSFVYYITLSNGKTVEDALHEMLDYNTTDSTIKTFIETWYNNNMTSYTDYYIEDAIYCNDRSVYEYNGWNPNGGNTHCLEGNIFLNFGAYGRESNPIVTCPRDIDKFTVSPNIGNGKLQYPVGLLTEDELRIAGSKTIDHSNLIRNTSYYLHNATLQHSISPADFGVQFSRIYGLSAFSTITNVGSNRSVRPVISLKPNIKLKNGDGTANNPYTVSKPSKSGKLKFVNRQNANNISVGDELKIGTEHFYVVSSNENETVLLAKYNLYVGDIYNGYDFERTISETEEGYGLQNENARGQRNKGTQNIGLSYFSDINYWSENGNLKSEYGDSYPANLYDRNSNLFKYVESYVTRLNGIGLSNISGRLLTYNEVENLGCDTTANSCYAAQEWVNTSTYWVGYGAYNFVAAIYKNGDTGGCDGLSTCRFGVRPVIVVPTSQLS